MNGRLIQKLFIISALMIGYARPSLAAEVAPTVQFSLTDGDNDGVADIINDSQINISTSSHRYTTEGFAEFPVQCFAGSKLSFRLSSWHEPSLSDPLVLNIRAYDADGIVDLKDQDSDADWDIPQVRLKKLSQIPRSGRPHYHELEVDVTAIVANVPTTGYVGFRFGLAANSNISASIHDITLNTVISTNCLEKVDENEALREEIRELQAANADHLATIETLEEANQELQHKLDEQTQKREFFARHFVSTTKALRECRAEAQKCSGLPAKAQPRHAPTQQLEMRVRLLESWLARIVRFLPVQYQEYVLRLVGRKK